MVTIVFGKGGKPFDLDEYFGAWKDGDVEKLITQIKKERQRDFGTIL